MLRNEAVISEKEKQKQKNTSTISISLYNLINNLINVTATLSDRAISKKHLDFYQIYNATLMNVILRMSFHLLWIRFFLYQNIYQLAIGLPILPHDFNSFMTEAVII